MNNNGIRILFAIAALYDFVIGLVFLTSGSRLFEATNVPQPKHWGYIQFGALLLMIFGLMFAAIAFNPRGNRMLIPYGILLKISYVSLVGYHWADTGVPWLFKPFFFIDLVMLVLFVVCYVSIGNQADAKLKL